MEPTSCSPAIDEYIGTDAESSDAFVIWGAIREESSMFRVDSTFAPEIRYTIVPTTARPMSAPPIAPAARSIHPLKMEERKDLNIIVTSLLRPAMTSTMPAYASTFRYMALPMKPSRSTATSAYS